MQTRNREAHFWDRLARKYARTPIKDLAGYERTIARTRACLAPSDAVLELGCGTGTTALKLAPAVATILGTDVSGEMIAIAREKATADAVTNATFEVAAAAHPPGTDGAFDAVMAFSLLHLIRDRAATYRHVHRLLKPGGLFISKTPCLSEMNVLIRLALPPMRLIGKAPYASFFSASELENEIEQAGFAIRERARHGTKQNEPRIFIVARKPEVSAAGAVGA